MTERPPLFDLYEVTIAGAAQCSGGVLPKLRRMPELPSDPCRSWVHAP